MKDLELHRWYFFTLRPELYLGVAAKRQGRIEQSSETAEEGYPLPPSFEQLFKTACTTLGLQSVALEAQRASVLETFKRLITEENTHWRDNQSRKNEPTLGVAIDAGVFNDVVFVCASAGYNNKEYDNAQISTLRSLINNYSANGEQFLGMLTCWVAEVEQGEDLSNALSQLQTDTALKGISADLVWGEGGALIRCGYDTNNPHHEIYCMVYRRGDEVRMGQLSSLRAKILPLIAIQRLKIRRILHDYPQVYTTASKNESTLESLMHEVDDQLDLVRVEQLSHDIARKQKEFLEIVSILEVYNETLSIAQKNIERLLNSGQLGTASQRARAQLFLEEEVATALERIQAHIRFLSVTRNQAELTLESLNTTAGVRNAQWLRTITYIGTPFAAASIIEAFQSDIETLREWLASSLFQLPLIVLKVVILAALVGGFYYFVNRLTRPTRPRKAGTPSNEK